MHTSTVYVPHLLKQPTFSVFDADCGEILKSTAASRKKAMRPSISVLEPGLDRGVPWGCDLYTFVTSAAGHMMRTLQKPRKNRPSKRQVNHRRFLHNMIQRKFADIEAANHRLASSLYFKEEEKNTSSLLSNKRDTSGNPPQSDSNPELKKHNVRADSMDVSKTDSNVSTNADETDVGAKKQSDFGHRWKCQHKSSSSSGGNNPSKGRQKKERPHKQDEFSLVNSPEYKNSFPEAELLYSEYFQHQSQFKPINVCSDDTQAPSNSSSSLFGCNENNSPSFNAALSPLSLDLWDFSGQMVSDLSACSEAQKTLNQGQLTDLYGLGNLHSKGWKDVEDYFESICSCQDGAMLEACADEEITFADLSESFTGTEDFHSEGREYKCSYSCPEDQRPTVNYFQDHQRSSRMLRQNKCTDEGQFNIFKPSQSTDTNLNLLSTSISCNVTQLQTHQRLQESSCINRNFTPFEGVAQSFSAPPHHHVCQPTPTPPLEEDWLFTDILKDKQFLNY